MPIVEIRETVILNWQIGDYTVFPDPAPIILYHDDDNYILSSELTAEINLTFVPDEVIVKYYTWIDTGNRDDVFTISSDLINHKNMFSICETVLTQQVGTAFQTRNKEIRGLFTFRFTNNKVSELTEKLADLRTELIADPQTNADILVAQQDYNDLLMHGRLQICLEFVRYKLREFTRV